MLECLQKFWGFAVEQLPYESREGGYQGTTWMTYELLFDYAQVDLPRDSSGDLASALPEAISEELWCDYDWLTLDDDVALSTSWERFCEIVKHHRRFFFGDIPDEPDARDHFVPSALLRRFASLFQQLDLIRRVPAGSYLFRARAIDDKKDFTSSDLGPPTAERALQSNRMNPPGVPMMYLSEDAATAIAEIRASSGVVATFSLLRDCWLLDLADLPEIPGVFSDTDRWTRLTLRLLHSFRDDINKPVERDERTHIDYIPTQIVTEYFRYADVPEGPKLDGIRYGLPDTGINVVLFAAPENVCDQATKPKQPRGLLMPDVFVELIAASRFKMPRQVCLAPRLQRIYAQIRRRS